MIELIQKYLSAHRKVELEGWGVLEVKTNASQLDFTNRQLNAPYFSLQFRSGTGNSDSFLKWLSKEKNISIEEAAAEIKNFISQFLSVLQEKKKIDWNGWGIFYRNTEGKIKFQSILTTLVTAGPVTAERVIRKGAEHQVRVGEDQKTNTEMELLLAGLDTKPGNKWWVPALIILFFSIGLAWYFSTLHKTLWTSQGNYRQIILKDAPSQYQEAGSANP